MSEERRLVFLFLPQILQTRETSNPFSLVVFNDMLYWTDAKKRVVRSAHKVSGKNSHVLLKRQRQPFGVKVSKPPEEWSPLGMM